MKSLQELWRVTANELAVWCHTSTTLDFKKLESRVEAEGLSFLTITLPSYGKDFERSLDQGFVDSSSFAGFKRKGGLPLFLGGFLSRIFDPVGCRLLDAPCLDSIFAIRQLCSLFSKISLPCSDARVKNAMQSYIECENEMREWEKSDLFETDSSEFQRISTLIFGDVFSRMETKVSSYDLIPKHGPGKTADRLSGNGKFDLTVWPGRLEDVLPYGEFAIPNWRYHYRYGRVQLVEPAEELPVKVVPVPKTLKTPRIIAIEPTAMQYAQQALLSPLIELLECPAIPGENRDNLAFGFVGFTDQLPNRNLARKGSIDGRLATLDLSEASDRVSNQHVLTMLKNFPHFSEAVQATRSTKADVLVGDENIELSLHKFASMGSALCFPFEAMVFTTAVFMGIQKLLNRRLTRSDIISLRGHVRVYGDDIIVPVDCVDDVIDVLARLGFKTNVNKSFWKGKFRESCGGDYYDGLDVTPVKVRAVFPTSHRDASEVISLVELRNHFYSRGLWRTTRFLDDKITKLLSHFPVVEETSPAIGRRSFLPYQEERTCERLHRPLVKAYVPSSRPPRSIASGEGALLKCLSKRGTQPFADPRHLERQGRPSAVDIKLRWVQPF
jgi:hypothetical protein